MFVGRRTGQRQPPYRPEHHMAVQIGLLETKISPILRGGFHSQPVESHLSGIPPAQPAAKGKPLADVVFRLGAALNQLVVLDRVESSNVPIGVVSIKLAIAGSQRQPAPMIDTAKEGIEA